MILAVLSMKKIWYREVGAYKFLGVIRAVSYIALLLQLKSQEARIKTSFVIIHHATASSLYPESWRMEPRMLPQEKINFCQFVGEQGKMKPKFGEDHLHLTFTVPILSKHI